jgi:hypothetical protein
MTPRHDRTGEPIEHEDTSTTNVPSHDRRCRNGWLGLDDEQRPIPCLHCKPHLAKTADIRDFGAHIK